MKRRLFFRHAQFDKLPGDVRAMSFGAYHLVDERQLAIRIDEERPSFRHLSYAVNDAVRFGHLFSGVAKNWIVQFQGFREPHIRVRIVTVRSEKRDLQFVQA